jgi:transposase-like protein
MSDFRRLFADEVILWAMRCHCECKVTYFEAEDMLFQRDVDLDH